jgi:cytochrome c-type biogenesis protein
MDTNNITLLSAFLAGVISFLSPCVLPVLPTYTAFLAGTGAKPTGRGMWAFQVNAFAFWVALPWCLW